MFANGEGVNPPPPVHLFFLKKTILKRMKYVYFLNDECHHVLNIIFINVKNILHKNLNFKTRSEPALIFIILFLYFFLYSFKLLKLRIHIQIGKLRGEEEKKSTKISPQKMQYFSRTYYIL